MRAAFLAVLLPTQVLASPLTIAEPGCVFRWEGKNDYHEIATSHGPGRFPAVRFSRADFGPQILDFVPFCGPGCGHPKYLAKFEAFLNLDVGSELELIDPNGTLRMVVLEQGPFPETGLVATRVRTSWNGQLMNESWWSKEIGWLVAYSDANVSKWVVDVSCPAGGLS